MQILNWILGKTSAVGRLIIFSALGGVLVAAMVVPVVAATGIVVRNTADKFSTIAVDSDSLAQRSAIYDREGHLITYVWNVNLGSGMTYGNGIDRQPVDYGQISPNMLTAIVAIEDDRFWQHGALDVKGTLRALVNDIEHKPIQGGSTLEQQYVKNVLVLQDLDNPAAQQAATADNLSRKLDQLRMAVQVAHTMTKQQILAGYLNDSYYGEGAWGIEAAAETYFNTTAAKLTMLQAATLAGIVENPTQYDPIAYPATSLTRRDTVLARIAQTNPSALAPAAALVLEAKKLGLHPGAKQSGCTASTAGQDAFFCDYVIHDVLNDPQLGATTMDRAKLLSTGGLKIYTTLAPQDESAATHAVNYVVPYGDNYYNPNHNVDTTALGAARHREDPRDRRGPAVRARPQQGPDRGRLRGQLALRRPGRRADRILIQAVHPAHGARAGRALRLPGDGPVLPERAGLHHLRRRPAHPLPSRELQRQGDKGTYTLYTGTADSINTFYAELEQKVGLCNVVHTAVSLGMTRADGKSLLAATTPGTGSRTTSPRPTRLTSFTLGSVNVSPLSMAEAYATVASGGIYCAPTAITKITDAGGQVAAGAVGRLPPGAVERRRRRRPTTSCRACSPGRGRPGWGSARCRAATRSRARPAPPTSPAATAPRTPPSPGTPPRWSATPRCSTRSRPRSSTRWAAKTPPTGTSTATGPMLGRDVRRQRARLDLAADVRLGQPRRVARLRDGLAEQRAVEQGQRPVVPPPPKAKTPGKGGGTGGTGGGAGGGTGGGGGGGGGGGAPPGHP